MLTITSDTRLGDLLAAHPETEAVLIRLAPAFAKLTNPVLRNTVAKFATLEQAAKIAGITCNDLVERLQQVVGQSAACGSSAEKSDLPASSPDGSPDWACDARAQHLIDGDALLRRGEHPVNLVLATAAELQAGEVIRLSTSFYPAPLVDALRKAGYAVVSRSSANQTLTYVCRT